MPEEAFANRLAIVEQRIASALARCGRERSEITLVAVSKKFSALIIEEAYRHGCRDFGENYVQEFEQKRPQLKPLPGAKFHLIGHLQSNKARLACELFEAVETVDSAKLLRRIDAAAVERETQIEVMLEVKLSREESKAGCDPGDIPALLDAGKKCRNINLLGLMTIPPWSEDPEVSRPYFRRLAELAKENALSGLSMGMSNDFEAAIEEGATHIRIGTALFGPRPKPKTALE